MEKIKIIFKNPIIISIILCLILIAIIFIGTKFQLPDFYTDRHQALEAIQISDLKQGRIDSDKFLNPAYKLWNPVYNFFAFCISLFFILLFFNIDEFKKFKKLINIKNKKFIFLWINLSYIFFIFAFQYTYMEDISKLVYHRFHDSLGIPYFQELLKLIFYSIMYYPVINVLFYIIYNTKISRIIYFIPLLYLTYDNLIILHSLTYAKYSATNIFIFFYSIIWLCLIISAFIYLFQKRKTNYEK